MSFNSARIKINQSSGQHDELQTAESPLINGFRWKKSGTFLNLKIYLFVLVVAVVVCLFIVAVCVKFTKSLKL